MFPIVAVLTAATFYLLHIHYTHWLTMVLMVVLSPGLIIYFMLTGDVHFGQEAAGIAVTGIGTWICWTFIVHLIYNKRKK